MVAILIVKIRRIPNEEKKKEPELPQSPAKQEASVNEIELADVSNYKLKPSNRE
jgi:hypothetical protein